MRPLVPDPVRDWLDTAKDADRSRLLARIDQAATVTDFNTAAAAASKLITLGNDPASASLGMLSRRMSQGTEPAPPMVDLRVYDQLAQTRDLPGEETA